MKKDAKKYSHQLYYWNFHKVTFPVVSPQRLKSAREVEVETRQVSGLQQGVQSKAFSYDLLPAFVRPSILVDRLDTSGAKV